MSASPPWKLVVTGAVGIVAGVALLSRNWTIATLAAFVGLALLTRGSLHLVASVSFVGFAGAFAVLAVAGDAGVGITALAWPHPTRLSLALLVGVWAVVRAIVGGTIAVTTRADHPWWLLSVVVAIIAGVLGVVLIARSGGSVRTTAVTIGLLMLLEGTREVSEGGVRHRRDRRLTQGSHTHSAAAA
ncbi:MAG TPA: DUF308 domain-containing protein [Mycobacterium sp.]|nr:DUF308 domain-containing protein [Mycobacterium sp.]